MKFRDWIEIVIGLTAGAGTVFLCKYIYKKLKKGKLDRLLSKEEKKTLLEALEEFLIDMKDNHEVTIQKNQKPK